MHKVFLLSLLVVVSCSDSHTDKQKSVRVLSEAERQRFVTPTIYYIPQYSNFDHQDCPSSQKMDLIDPDNRLIVSSCRRIYRSCQMQGTCQIEIKNKKVLINVDRINQNGVRTFKVVDESSCRYGLGNASDRLRGYKKMCVDPFYSVAADLSIYNLGDVIYIPLLKGVVLPNGQLHSGYVIVRDSGSMIKGPGRFDFFTGFLGMSRSNPFFKIGLGGDKVFPEYYLIRGPEADEVRQARSFPLLTRSSSTHRLVRN